MKVEPYPEYKNTGVEWLGQIPEHWHVANMRWLTRRYSGGTPDKANLGYWEGGTIPWLNSGSVNDRFITEPSALITKDGFENSSAKWILEGALVMALAGQGKTKGMVAQLGIPSTCNQSMAAIIPNPEIDPRFLYWWLESNYQNIRNMSGGDLRDGLNLSILGDIKCPVTTIDEQVQIREYLDLETAKIDSLISAQRELIVVLWEMRQAIISQSIIKGLNSDVVMKDSGNIWFGEIPSHWMICPLKWLTDPKRPIMYGIVLPGPDVEEGVPILKGGNVKTSRMNLQSMARTTPQIEAPFARARLKGGDLVYAIRGSIGDCEIVPNELDGSNITQDVARVAVDKGVCAPWVRWALLSSAVREGLACGSLGAAIQGINIFDLKRARIPTPPLGEQYVIADFINDRTQKLETLIEEAQLTIDLLQERRTALISAVVTGKVDVREVACV